MRQGAHEAHALGGICVMKRTRQGACGHEAHARYGAHARCGPHARYGAHARSEVHARSGRGMRFTGRTCVLECLNARGAWALWGTCVPGRMQREAHTLEGHPVGGACVR
jgi:hypothetical protein